MGKLTPKEGSYRILAINPGSTSTKIAVFYSNELVFSKSISHDAETLKQYGGVDDQLHYRKDMVEQALRENGIDLTDIDVFVGRGGGLVPICGGTYVINEKLLEHARLGTAGKHPAQLAAQICELFSQQTGAPAYVVNPPDVDEFDDISRLTGLSDVFRESRIHTLNQKEVAIRYCNEQNRDYHSSRLIVCHVGGGISVTAHCNGRMIDSNDIMNGDGPMTPTRSGALPAIAVIQMAYSGKYTEKQLKERINKNGGFMDHLGTADAREVEARIEKGDAYAKLVYDAMIYQIAKCIGAYACSLRGQVDAILLTGGMAHSEYLTGKLGEYICWIAPVEIRAGEFEMEALAAGVVRVLEGQETVLIYSGEPVWTGFNK